MYPDNRFEMLIDQTLVNNGSLLEDMEPAVMPPREIEDPKDTKPSNWDDRPHIPDPTVIKPHDWCVYPFYFSLFCIFIDITITYLLTFQELQLLQFTIPTYNIQITLDIRHQKCKQCIWK